MVKQGDIESSSPLVVETAVADVPQERTTTRSSAAWKWLLAASLACFLASHVLDAASETIQTLVVRSSSSKQESEDPLSLALSTTTATATSTSTVGWHIKPIHPHHSGRVVYLTEKNANGIIYKRVFSVPCNYGMLVFNVGPAKSYEPFSYDVYEGTPNCTVM